MIYSNSTRRKPPGQPHAPAIRFAQSRSAQAGNEKRCEFGMYSRSMPVRGLVKAKPQSQIHHFFAAKLRLWRRDRHRTRAVVSLAPFSASRIGEPRHAGCPAAWSISASISAPAKP
jgi:hypothetical protein